MDIISILLINLFCCVFLLTITKVSSEDADICTSAKGLPQFNLFCTDNKTLMIHFPYYGDLVVKSIAYDTRSLDLLDPKNCVHEVFLNLNLSFTPFTYYYDLKEYRYINCSAKLDTASDFVQVPCLSGSTHHVYVMESFSPVPVSCISVKTVAIPFSYSPYLSDNSFGLRLTWNDDDEEEENSGCKEKYFKVLGITGIILMAGILLYAIISECRQQLNEEKKKVKDTIICEVEIDKLLGEYEALNPAKFVRLHQAPTQQGTCVD
ncbi:hypothetical protein BUALT_Bualt10G0021000 [Buddleja alternifolia]|uniref:RING-type E3 ubiquitin transferase n=1 Tax=Buddleja alternifolia TaxID=168488 RepID=A0AAV6WX80_9LAMI|nr:hypothetical protein BUALT_Bualt10G0021000 [Buddleja alternifolia]